MNDLKSQIDSYEMSDKSRQILAQSPIVMLVSITGGGKNTIINELLKTDAYHYVISHTTRTPRENDGVMEQDGISYWFASEEEMSEKLQKGEFIEAKWVHNAYVYGTSVAELTKAQETGKIPLLEIDIQGAEEIARAKSDARVIFILPPNYDIWLERLHARGELAEEELQRRLSTAKTELETALKLSYTKFVINDDLAEAIKDTQGVIDGGDDSVGGRQVAEDLLNNL